MKWEPVADGVFLFRDSCLVYAVRGPEGTVLINAGTGRAADHLGEVAQGKVTVVLTHHFRDHSDGARRLASAGAEILGPYWEQEYLVDPEQHFRERQTWVSYDNRWDRFSPVNPLPVSGWLMDYEKRKIAGLEWEVIPTPGVTNGASSYVTTLNGRRYAFVGELICGPGRIARMAPLQYNYNDLSGASNVWRSLNRLKKANPDMILPSLGAPIADPMGAIEQLRGNLKGIELLHPGEAPGWDSDEDDIEEVLPHVFRARHSGAETHFVVSGSGKVLALDYGYNYSAYVHPNAYHMSNRRPFLHGIGGLKKRFGTDRIDAVLISHYHDDHINGIPLLQRLYGTEVWAAEKFADILERPWRYDRPCLWPEPIKVARSIAFEQRIEWEGVPIVLKEMSGHTQFSALLCLEVDGTRIVHTGDQLFFWGEGSPYGPKARIHSNHVYKNGLDLGCYWQTVKHMRDFKPELVLTGHTHPYRPDAEWYRRIEDLARNFDEVHRKLMILGDSEAHFGAESQGGKLLPYRAHRAEADLIEFEGWVLNPLPTRQEAVVRIVGPEGWKGDPVALELGPRERKDIRLSVTPPPGTRCRRQPVALDLVVGDRPFGQVTEALVTIGFPRF